MKRLFIFVKLCFNSSPWGFVIFILLSIFSAPFPVIAIYYGGQLVDKIISGIPSNDYKEAYIVIVLLVIVAILSSVFNYIIQMSKEIIITKLDKSMRLKLIDTVSSIDYLTFCSNDHKDKFNAAKEAGGTQLISLFNNIVYIIQCVIQIISYIIILGAIARIITLIGGLTVFFTTIIIGIKTNKDINEIYYKTIREKRMFGIINNHFHENVPLREMAILGFKPRMLEKYQKSFDDISVTRIKMERNHSLRQMWLNIFRGSVSIIILVLTFIFGKIKSAGNVTIIITSIFNIHGRVERLGECIVDISQSVIEINRYYEYIEQNKTKFVHKNLKYDTENEIEIKNISFSFDGKKDILKNFSLSIRKGETIAFVGENGAGKTTLSNLILGLYRPTTGNINICGKDPYKSLMNKEKINITAILQNFTRYSGVTMRENITYGNNFSDVMIKNIDNFFSDVLLNSVAGSDFGGINLSGGQWQKIALARTLVNSSSIVLLDEPTAALDPISEVKVFRKFMELHEGKTRIIITHRLGAVRNADRIVVLKDGMLYEQGSHDELMNDINSLYKEMFLSQAQWYTD